MPTKTTRVMAFCVRPALTSARRRKRNVNEAKVLNKIRKKNQNQNKQDAN